MNTLTFAPCIKHKTTIISRQKRESSSSIHRNLSSTHHGFGRQIRLELSPNHATVPVRPSDLPPNAAIMRPIFLDFRLVDVGQPLAAVPANILLRVHPLDLKQRRVLILIRFRPKERSKATNLNTKNLKNPRERTRRYLASCIRGSCRARTICDQKIQEKWIENGEID